MKIFNSGISKFILACLVVFGFSGSLYSDNLADENAQKAYLVVVETLGNTAIGETAGKLTKQVCLGLSNDVAKRFMSAESYNVLQSEFSEAILDSKIKYKIKDSFKKGAIVDIAWLIGDLFIELAKHTVDESNLEYRYKESVKWWIQIAYVDLKAVLNPNKIDAAYDFVSGNGEVLLDMGNKINITLKELGTNTWEAKYSNVVGDIMFLEHQYLVKFAQAETKDEKDDVIVEFKNKCLEKKVFGDVFSTGHRSVFNAKIDGLAISGELDIRLYDRDKLNPLIYLVYNNQREQFDRFLENFFPQSEHEYLKRYFEIQNFDYYYGIKTNQVGYKQLQEAIAHGFLINNFNINASYFIPTKTMSEKQAFSLINIGYGELNGATLENGYSATQLITRRKFAQLLNEVFQLDESLSEKKRNALARKGASLDGSVGWFYDALVLKEFSIAKGQGIGAANQFRPDDNLTMYELLVMLVNTMNYKKCGQAQCNIADIMEVQ